MRRPRLLILGAAGLVIAVVALLRVGGREEEVGPTATAERQTIERIVVASGTIEPEQLIEVRSKVSGIVERFLVAAGDRVRAGQVVAEIDREALEAAVREARAAVREAEAGRDLAAAQLERRRQTFRGGLDSRDAFDQTEAQHARAVAQVERARATRDRLEQELSWATITAPIDGVVLERDLDPGAAVASVATVTGGTVLMTIADTSRMHLKGVVDENEIARVQVGQPARIHTEAHPERVFPGKVRKIAPIGTRKSNVTSFNVEVDVLDGMDALAPRMSADADIVADVHERAIVIPEGALVYQGDQVFVDVVTHASARRADRRAVRAGISNADRVEITEGLDAGTEVKLQ